MLRPILDDDPYDCTAFARWCPGEPFCYREFLEIPFRNSRKLPGSFRKFHVEVSVVFKSGSFHTLIETAKRDPIMTRLRTALIMGPGSHYPPHDEIETRRMRAYSMLVIEVLTLRASPIVLPPSAPSLLRSRLRNGGHNEVSSKYGPNPL